MFIKRGFFWLLAAVLAAAIVVTGVLIYQNNQPKNHDVKGTDITSAESGEVIPSGSNPAGSTSGETGSVASDSSATGDTQGTSTKATPTAFPEPTPNDSTTGTGKETSSVSGETTKTPGETTKSPGETSASSGEVKYQYDILGRVISATFPDGTSLLYTYDANGNLLSVKQDAKASSKDRG